ncbi:hypothetical protein [Streptomyces carminius]|uniref:hypothetical protein n=1 Tax=Streptomyces carminius TaxID=2665496 RepID=UPI002FCE2275
MAATRIELFGSLVHLHPGGQVRTERSTADTELERDGRLLMVARAETDADIHGDRWEVHT